MVSSSTTSIQTGLPQPTSTGSNPDGFIGNKPSTVLFFVALCIGVCIAVLFMFFTMRYFVRSRFGMYVPVSAYNLGNRTGPVFASGRNAFAFFTPVQDLHFGDVTYIPQNAAESNAYAFLINNGRRFRKKFRLTKQQVDDLFPVKTYHEWVNGGQEEDAANRKQNVIVCEEAEVPDTAPVEITGASEHTETTPSSSAEGHSHEAEVELEEIDLTEASVAKKGAEPPREQQAHFTSGICAICIDTLEDDDQVRGLICGHVYHSECIDPWLINRRASCPMCKRDYYIHDENEADVPNDSDSLQNIYFPRTTSYRAQNLLAALQSLRTPDAPTASAENTPQENEQGDEMVDLADAGGQTGSGNGGTTNTGPSSGASPRSHPFNPADIVDLDVEAQRRVEEKSKWYHWIFWRLMGITPVDLFNHYVVDVYERRRYERRSNQARNANHEAGGSHEQNDVTMHDLRESFVHSLV
ncbi:unnamed protein product [Kuraishia capsulata CBS 1993]|uniref:RING-type domain-containing protein n=1 Tax=Kuraishia capsulata CBS 1993 TaxID=1382522 RepID=W6MW03_9ASCO|nr:uncharacterized protein KUCA_T00002689001 [Kuraishia capsulata CBS 1993]CDK26715.1 unnamed protein product [Kuraishia capsulata CBS 1993]